MKGRRISVGAIAMIVAPAAADRTRVETRGTCPVTARAFAIVPSSDGADVRCIEAFAPFQVRP
jgi:hypothetical protein